MNNKASDIKLVSLYSTILSLVLPNTHTHTRARVCVCVCVCVYIYIYIYIMLHCRANTFMMYWELCWKNRPWPTDERNMPATPWRDWRYHKKPVTIFGWELHSWFSYCSVWCFLLLHLFSDAITNSNVRETGTTTNELQKTCHDKRLCRQLAP